MRQARRSPRTTPPARRPAVAHRDVFAPDALNDLCGLYDAIADAASPESAFSWVEAFRRHLLGFAVFPECGTLRDAIRPGLRTSGYRRRVTIALHATHTEVIILRVLDGGRDVGGFAAGRGTLSRRVGSLGSSLRVTSGGRDDGTPPCSDPGLRRPGRRRQGPASLGGYRDGCPHRGGPRTHAP
jgi:plasmid stabilization system protein ParE